MRLLCRDYKSPSARSFIINMRMKQETLIYIKAYPNREIQRIQFEVKFISVNICHLPIHLLHSINFTHSYVIHTLHYTVPYTDNPNYAKIYVHKMQYNDKYAAYIPNRKFSVPHSGNVNETDVNKADLHGYCF